MEENMIVLTPEILDELRTARGGYTSATILALGQKPGAMRKGWLNGLVGKSISKQQLDAARKGRMIFANASGNKVECTALQNPPHDKKHELTMEVLEVAANTDDRNMRRWLVDIVDRIKKL